MNFSGQAATKGYVRAMKLEGAHMARVFLVASVRAAWHGNSLNSTPATAAQMAEVSIRLLIEELGTDKARKAMRKEFARYRRDYKGAGKGDGSPMISD